MTNITEGSKKRTYDLVERTIKFAGDVLVFVKTVPVSHITKPIISQLVRSATSVGANYHEANDAESKSDFRHKVGICRKESRETEYWLQMLVVAYPDCEQIANRLADESQQLNRIFSASVRTVSKNINH